MAIQLTCIIDTKDRWNSLCSLLDEQSIWKLFAEKKKAKAQIEGNNNDTIEPVSTITSRELFCRWQSELLEILRTENHDAISLIQSWITEYDNLDPIVLYEQGMEYHWKLNYSKAIPCIEKAADKNYPPAYLRLVMIYSNKEHFTGGEKYEKLCIPYKYWFMEQALTGDPQSQYNMGLYLDCVENNQTEALQWYQKSADQNFFPAQNSLANLFVLGGKGVTKDENQAIHWYKKAAEQGFVLAEYHLGRCYGYGTGVAKDIKLSMYWLQRAAEQGNVFAQYEVGLLYDEDGLREKAVYWYHKAAEQGNCKAQYNLGCCYDTGSGIQKDEEKAFYWYEKSALQGDSNAQRVLGEHLANGTGTQKDEAKAFYWFQQAAEQGEKQSQFNVGYCYHWGKGVTKNTLQAIHWYQKVVDTDIGTPREEVEYLLGSAYHQDNFSMAYQWYKKAADKGHIKSQAQVGAALWFGFSVKKEPIHAVFYLKKAAVKGNAKAQCLLGKIFQGAEEYSKAVYWFRKAAETGNLEAQSNLGWCYYHGYGVKQDYSMAVHWYQKAENDGIHGLSRCYQYGEGVEQDINKAISLLQSMKAISLWQMIKAKKTIKRIQQVGKIDKCSKEER